MTVDLIKGARETFNNLLLFLTKKREREQATIWFPDDIMFEILIKLPNASLRHCLYVSKQFHNIISDLTFETARSPIKPALIMHLHPCHVKVPRDHLYLHLANDWYDRVSASSVITIERPPSVPDLSKLRLVDSCNEMLCFLQQNKDQSIIHIYNSQTNQWMPTPPFEPSRYPDRRVPLCGLYYHQGSRCYRVFAFVNQNGYLVHDLSTGVWRRAHRYEHFPGLSSWIDGAVLMNGRLHWSTRTQFAFCLHEIIAFDINLETFYTISRRTTMKEMNCKSYQPLIKTKAGLGCPVMINGTINIWVLTDYNSNTWRLLYRITNYGGYEESYRLLRGPILELLIKDEGEHWLWKMKKLFGYIKVYNCETGTSRKVQFDASFYGFLYSYYDTGYFFWQVPRSIRQRAPERKKIRF